MPTPAQLLPSAHIAALFAQSVLYGIYLVTCWFAATKVLRTRDNTSWLRLRDINWIVLIVGLAMFVNGTFNLALGLARLVIAFVYAKEGPLRYFATQGRFIDVAKNTTIHIQFLLGDFVLIYRCFFIYSRSKAVIVVPVILWIGGFYIFIHGIIYQSTETANLVSKTVPNGVKYFTAFWAVTITQNTISTGLIVLRLWRVESNLSGTPGTDNGRMYGRKSSPLLKVMTTIVESGLLMTAFSLMTFVQVLVKSVGVYITVNAGIAVVAIAFNLIIIRSIRGGGATSQREMSTRGQVSGIEVRMETLGSSDAGTKGRMQDSLALEAGKASAY